MSDSDSDEEWETARREHKQQVQPDDGHLSPATSVTSATSGGLDEPEREERPARSPLRLRTVPSSPHYRLSSEDEDEDTDVAVGGRVLSDEMDDSDGTFMDEVPSEDEQEEEGASAPIAYIGVAKPIKSLRHAIEDIKAEVLGPPPERPPSVARAWKAADEERLLRAIAGATEIPVPEGGKGPSYETFARAVGREIEDVMVHMQEAKGHAAMRLARKLLGMELLMEATDQGEQFVEGDDLASYLIREELEIRPHRALHVDVQQVCDRLSLQVGGMQTGWNVLREHKEMEDYDANLAVDIIEKGEQVFATDAQTCRPEDCSVEEWEHNPLCRGCGVVRLRIVRHYHNGRLVPNSEVEAEREDLAAQLTEYEAQHGVRSLRERAQRAWDEHPDRTGEEDDPSPAFGMMGRQELVDEILATEIIEFPLWASMYSEEGRRLLELLPMVRPLANSSAFSLTAQSVVARHLMCPLLDSCRSMSDVRGWFVQHGDVQPSKPISFGSRRGLTAVRNTHSVHERDGTEGTGHANTERQVRPVSDEALSVILLFFCCSLRHCCSSVAKLS
eukprot:COSAG04_NODE_19_length_39217_cov_21.535968_2_plen_560_part_00